MKKKIIKIIKIKLTKPHKFIRKIFEKCVNKKILLKIKKSVKI
jgi:hypothetical protein